MRRLIALSTALLFVVATASQLHAQSARPQFRPAVLITGPDSLVNRIDAKALLDAGQTDAAVMFCARAQKDGRLAAPHTYHGSPGSEKLAAELLKRLPDTKIAPAIYNYQPVDALFYGTAICSVVLGKPQVRIFLNQDSTELKKGNDFIGPQPVYGGESPFSGWHYPNSGQTAHTAGIVGVTLKVDVKGDLQNLAVSNEEPADAGFAAAASTDLTGAKFIPAFRDGDADACETNLVVYYSAD